jgi:hypothetical protein
MPSKRQRQRNQKRNMRGGDLLKPDKDQIIKYVDELKKNIENMPEVAEPVVGNTEVKPVVESEEGNAEEDKSVVTNTMPGGRKKSQKRKQRKNRKSQRRQKRR